MSMQNETGKYASEDQLLLARLYKFVTYIGFSCIAIAFMIYAFGVLPSHLPVGDVSSFWHLSASDFAAATQTLQGWDMISTPVSGDAMSLASLVLMPVAVITCLTIMAFAFARKRNWPFLAIVSLEVLVLLLAAGGVASGQ